MDELIAFVKARLDDDERYVRAVKAAGERLKANPDPRMAEFGMSAADAFLDNWDDLAEFTRWKCAVPADLDRQLREIAAKRAIVAEHAPYDCMEPKGQRCYRCASDKAYRSGAAIHEAWPCATLRHLADIWSDHPDYRTEWAPPDR